MVPRAKGGSDLIKNAIPLCFECHAEVHTYNTEHPRGRKFTPSELRKHKKQWLSICAAQPGALLAPMVPADVGPVQALVDELTLNAVLLEGFNAASMCELHDHQLRRAITSGAIAVLDDELRAAYSPLIERSPSRTTSLDASFTTPRRSRNWGTTCSYRPTCPKRPVRLTGQLRPSPLRKRHYSSSSRPREAPRTAVFSCIRGVRFSWTPPRSRAQPIVDGFH